MSMNAPIEDKQKDFFYSIALNLTDRVCLVVGGGQVALRKSRSLLRAGAQVTVIGEHVLEAFHREPLQVKEALFSEQDIIEKDPFLVIACTNNRDVNHKIADICHQRKILVNVADNLHESDFIVQSSFHRNDLLISLSTNGHDPGFAKKMRTYLEEVVDTDFADALDITATLREEVLLRIDTQKKREKHLRRIDLFEVLQLLQDNSKTAALERMRECLFSSLD